MFVDSVYSDSIPDKTIVHVCVISFAYILFSNYLFYRTILYRTITSVDCDRIIITIVSFTEREKYQEISQQIHVIICTEIEIHLSRFTFTELKKR